MRRESSAVVRASCPMVKPTMRAEHGEMTLLRRDVLQIGVAVFLSAWGSLPALCSAEGPPEAESLESPLSGESKGVLDPQRILERIDAQQRNQGDWRASVYMEQRVRDKVDVAYAGEVYRRGEDGKFLLLFTRPKASRGQGYLRLGRNLWFYEPAVGRWERTTERARINGTNSRRSDFDASRLGEDYTATLLGAGSLGRFEITRLRLKSRAGVDVAFPEMELWVDRDSGNLLKRQDYAPSGRLLRTTYYPKWRKVYSPSKQAEVWYAEEIRVFDEVEKDSSTLILLRDVECEPLPRNLFTKAWLESKSR